MGVSGGISGFSGLGTGAPNLEILWMKDPGTLSGFPLGGDSLGLGFRVWGLPCCGSSFCS